MTGAERLNAAAYETLGLMSFYTMGHDEARAWTIRKGTLAPQAGGKVHTDIERGFIRAEIYRYKDLVDLGSYKAIQEAHRVTLEGKDYEMQEGDVAYFRFSV